MGDLIDVVADPPQLGEHLGRQRPQVVVGVSSRGDILDFRNSPFETGRDELGQGHACIGCLFGQSHPFVRR